MQQQPEAAPAGIALEQGEYGLAALIARNRDWAAARTEANPGFFQHLADQQRPNYFWVGCSDSRVPATEIVDLDPGDMFVHRNVANLAIADDPNFSAALQFAVEALEVGHILVVGHYGCGGIRAAMRQPTPDAVGRWIAPVRALHHAGPCNDPDSEADANALCERNVMAQVGALADHPFVRAAWERGAKLALHGWVYAIADGLLKPLCEPVTGPRR